LERIPLFVRYGALIPVTTPGDTVDTPDEITLVAFGGGDSRTEIHDEDGKTVVVAHRDGDTLHVAVTGPKRIATVEFAPVAGAPGRAVITQEKS
jgi:alpha-D-xyloside xylohydrolase